MKGLVQVYFCTLFLHNPHKPEKDTHPDFSPCLQRCAVIVVVAVAGVAGIAAIECLVLNRKCQFGKCLFYAALGRCCHALR